MAQDALQFLVDHPLVLATIKILIVFLVLSGLVAYLVYLERKILAFIQARLGPMRVGPWGLLQPIADGLKLLLKEDIVPAGADKFVFLLAPVISVVAAFTVFAAIPFGDPITIGGRTITLQVTDVNIGIMFILAVSSLGIYGIILGGWASNSHYPLLGALRSSAQLVSYEVAAGMAIVGVLLISNSLSMFEIVKRQQEMGVWNFFLQPVAFVIYLIAALAETNRNPFDLPEAESELTAGFHTEYSGFRFSLYFLAEYTNMVLVSAIAVTLFWGGWLRPFSSVAWLGFLKYAPPLVIGIGIPALMLYRRTLVTPIAAERNFSIALCVFCLGVAGLLFYNPILDGVQGIFWFGAKVLAFLYAFIWYRGTFPRYRYDQLMNLGWRYMIPIALANLIVTAVVRWALLSRHTHEASTASLLGWW